MLKNIFTEEIYFSNKQIKVFELNELDIKEKINLILHKAEKAKIQINYSNVLQLVNKVNDDTMRLINEFEKIALVTKNITIYEINELIVSSINFDPFAFINSLEQKKLNIIWDQYLKKIIAGENITMLIYQISQNLIICNQMYYYLNNKKI
ncbi:hypothetical protein [Mycoplasma sp. 1018B]|uniref:hypothetical protein n=1 Tax=Mycoplasma sp. 1018B TaxID=2967302 RepID=UPI00211BA37A|nr:hypothetical protein [Mycoplasma sp. 1018B]UUM19089.1 hypothetical protein NPA14_01975 [Mycoplasma sp. 1018B]